jgi:SNF2 family DNA or RNA helicase
VIVVHAAWSARGLHLWGESAAAPAPAPARRPGRPPRVPRPRPHPFAAGPDALRPLLVHLGAADAQVQPLALHLPSHPRGPQASPQLPGASSTEADAVAAWTVPAATADGIAALELLLALPASPPEGAAWGDTLRALAEVAKLALELVARGRVLPALERADGGWRASWRPVLTDDGDAERMSILRRALPGACAAASDPAAPVDDVAARVLDALVDACARQGLAKAAPAKKRGKRSAADAWLDALYAPAGGMVVDAAAAPVLQRAVEGWSRLAAAPSTGVRTLFHLSEPEAGPDGARAKEGAPWRLDFLLQAPDDPSLLVPAAQVWSTRGPLKLLRRTIADPQEALLADLGRALRLFPPLEPALRGARPTGSRLDADGAYRFLREGAPLLTQAGFAVRVPPWAGRSAARLGLTLKASSSRKGAPGSAAEGKFGLDSIVQYQWQVSLGGEPVSAAEFRALAKAKVPLVRLRGQWVEVSPDDLQAALRIFERGDAGEMTAAELMRLAAGADGGQDAALPLDAVQADGWLGELLRGAAEARVDPIPVPAGLQATLRPYQERGLSWLVFLDRLGLGGCLADDMGLGKTIQLLSLLLAERPAPGKRGERPAPTLLVCPMSLVGNWQREAARFAPSLDVHIHHGGERLGGDALRQAVAGSDLVVTTYALAGRDHEELREVQWGRVVLDEAQNVKNPHARQTQAVRALPAARRVALTGTPVENRLSELWSVMEFLNPGLLGSLTAFRSRFATPIEKYRDADSAAALRKLTEPFILRRLKTDPAIIQDLPDKLEMKVFCNLTREQATLYQAVVDEMMERIASTEGIERRGLVLSTLMKLKQVCNHPAQLTGDHAGLAGRSGKLARLEELLDEVMEIGERALVFTQFAAMGHLLRDRLQERLGVEVPFLHGGTRKADRDALVQRFQSADGPPVLLLSLKAGGTGLTLTAANHVVHFDRWWNPAVEDQATDRAFRIGQTRNVQVRKLVCAGTLEERIDEMIEDKKQLAASVLGTGEAWLTELSTDELRRIVALSPDAVAE